MNPYKDEINENFILREFSTDVELNELVWHRDKKDRVVEVLGGDGWKFQLDENLPIELKKGNVIKIKAEMFHRIFKGTSPLKLKIKES